MQLALLAGPTKRAFVSPHLIHFPRAIPDLDFIRVIQPPGKIARSLIIVREDIFGADHAPYSVEKMKPVSSHRRPSYEGVDHALWGHRALNEMLHAVLGIFPGIVPMCSLLSPATSHLPCRQGDMMRWRDPR
jgi:hypothetical protein